MLKLLSCAQGHYWEKAIEDGTPEFCPRCGQAAETLPHFDLAAADKPPIARAEPPAAPPLRDPEGLPILAGYEIISYLGKGSTGIHLYKARQIVVNRLVVLKVVFAKEDPRQLAWGSLRNEASALGTLHHPNIVQIHEAGERDRQLFYNAVEYVNGPTLTELSSGKPLPIRPAVALVETLARAVHQAHQKNILHRNLKPASILLDNGTASALIDDCIVKITDWGLARRATEGDLSDVELQGDQPYYLSPEQVWGRAKEIGPATDVYALGAILYTLIGGRPPFHEATAAETLDAIGNSEPPRLSHLRSGVSRNLEAICRKCLTKQPRRRYASALELAEDLQRWTNGYPVKARLAGNTERVSKWMRRNFRTVALVLLSLWMGLSLLMLLDGREHFLSSGIQRRTSNLRPDPLLLDAAPAVAHEREAAADYVRYLLLAERAADDRDAQRGQDLLAKCPSALRHWEWHYLHGRVQDAGNEVVKYYADLPIRCLDLSRDGRYLAAGGGREPSETFRGAPGEVSVWDLQTQARLHHWKVNAPVRGVAFRPDSGSLAFLSVSNELPEGKSAIEAIDLKTGASSFRRSYPDSQLASLTYCWGRQDLLACADDSTVRLLRAEDGEEVRRYEIGLREVPGKPPPRRRGSSGRLLPIPSQSEPNRLAFVSPDGDQLVLADARAARPSIEVIAADAYYFSLAYDKKTETLAAAGLDQTIHLWDVHAPPRLKRILRSHKGSVLGVSFSSDGKRLASCGADGTVRIWDVEQGLDLLHLTGFKDASIVLFCHAEEEGDDIGGRNRGLDVRDRLLIAHGNKVTIIEPR